MEILLPDNVAQTTFHVRYAETDMMGIVHHSAYIPWLEEARSAFMRLLKTSYTEFEADGVALAVSEITVRYHAPARYDHLVAVQCHLQTLKSRGVTFAYTILNPDTGQTLATAVSHHICVNAQQRVVRIPPKWHQLWAEHLSA